MWSELREKIAFVSLVHDLCLNWLVSCVFHLVQPCAWFSLARTCYSSHIFVYLCCPEVLGSRTPEVLGCSSLLGSSSVHHQEFLGPVNLTAAFVEKISGKPIHSPPLGYISARSIGIRAWCSWFKLHRFEWSMMSDLGGKDGEIGKEDGASSKGTPSPKGATIPFDYSKLTIPSHNFVSVPSGRAPQFDGTHYAAWKHKMKLHLIALHPSIWKVICTCIDVPYEDMELTSEQEQLIHHNAQASMQFSPPWVRRSSTRLMDYRRPRRYGILCNWLMRDHPPFVRPRLNIGRKAWKICDGWQGDTTRDVW